MPQAHESAGVPIYLGVSRAAEMLGISERTLRRWITEGKVPAYRVADHSIRVTQADVMKLVEPMTIAGGVS